MTKSQMVVEHRIHESERSFEAVVDAFEAATGSVDADALAAAMDEAVDAAQFEAIFKAQEATSGFMRFMRIDHGRWIGKFGIEGRSILYVLGNPLIARTMLCHDIGVGLYVPIRLAIEQRPGAKVIVRYDLPSTAMRGLGSAAVEEAAQNLDRKLTALAEAISGTAA